MKVLDEEILLECLKEMLHCMREILSCQKEILKSVTELVGEGEMDYDV